MSVNSTYAPGTPIAYRQSTINTGSADKYQKGHGSGDTWYHHYICANSFAYLVHAAYDFWGSDHVWIKFMRYSISQQKWVQVQEKNYAKDEDLRIGCNLASYSGYHWNYDGTDSIHFDIMTDRIHWGGGKDKGSENFLYMGDLFCTTQDKYNSRIKNTLIKGKKLGGVTGGVLWHVTGSAPSNPFNTEWGNITSARGSFIKANDPYRIISDYQR